MAHRTLAVSVVATISLADMACTPSGNGQPPPEQISMNPPEPDPVPPPPIDRDDAVENEAGDDGAGEAENDGGNGPVVSNTRVEKRGGRCVEIVDVQCAEGEKCNPPPPKQVPCPDELLSEPAADEKTFSQNDGTCWAYKDFKCPEGATCNPPPPRQVLCPPGEKLPKAKNAERVTKRPNGECWESFSASCPPGARCNPPPPRRVECPPDVE